MRAARISALILVGIVTAGFWFLPAHLSARLIHGIVVDEHGPVAGVRVHFQGTQPVAFSDVAGRFQLPGPGGRRPVVAWKAGYRISAAAPQQIVRLKLESLPRRDSDDYRWIDPHPNLQQPKNCGNCHKAIYNEWRASSHGQSAHNSRFLSLYDGKENTWNLSKEHPLGAGVCASCHAPTFTDSTLEYDMRRVRGIAAKGVHCDYCHKIAAAPVDKLGTRFGRDGLRLLRPANGEQFFFGPLDDAVRAGESFAYAPLYKESRYCASCHEGVIFGVHVYGTYSEWLQSPARERGQECQTCHMAPSGRLTNIAPGKGGIERDPRTLASHTFPGGQAEMLRRCLKVSVKKSGPRVAVEVRADNVGHRVPTGFIDRNLLLTVEASDGNGKLLPFVDGPRLPASAGKKLAGSPGVLYAKQLLEPDGRGPIPFWLPHGDVVDTRLLPEKAERSDFTFAAAINSVRVRLLYRRFWQPVAEARGWRDFEIVVFDNQKARRKR